MEGVRAFVVFAALSLTGCVAFLPASDRADAGRDGATGNMDGSEVGRQDVPPNVDAAASPDAVASDVASGMDSPLPSDAEAPDGESLSDGALGPDGSVTYDANGLVLVTVGFGTASASTGVVGTMRLTSVGFVGGDRQCVGTLCLSGAISP